MKGLNTTLAKQLHTSVVKMPIPKRRFPKLMVSLSINGDYYYVSRVNGLLSSLINTSRYTHTHSYICIYAYNVHAYVQHTPNAYIYRRIK